jgi:hypothetical protein
MQLCEWLRRTAAYSVAVIALRYQKRLDMADSAGRMINPAERPFRSLSNMGAPKWSKDCCGSSLPLLERAVCQLVEAAPAAVLRL